ncbi:DUF1804 family protein [Enterobacter mori]|uniref:DUF1804 family protein n=1 Tax=Enterobacter mori TaxID=539813 RepID=UPI003B840FF4
MAWPKEVKDKVRSAYVFNQFALEVVTLQQGVPYDTARRWKMQAAKNGDDWDKVRVPHTLAGDGLESMARTVLMSLVIKCQATMELINQNPDIPAPQAVELLTSLADSLSKTVAPSKKMLPETDRLATALEVLQMLGAYISDRHPTLNASFLEVLEGFSGVLEKDFD